MVFEVDASGLDFIGRQEFDQIQNKLIVEFIVDILSKKWMPCCEIDVTHSFCSLLTSQYQVVFVSCYILCSEGKGEETIVIEREAGVEACAYRPNLLFSEVQWIVDAGVAGSRRQHASILLTLMWICTAPYRCSSLCPSGPERISLRKRRANREMLTCRC